MKTNTMLRFILAVTVLVPMLVCGQASKVRLSVATIADLEARTPQTGEMVEVRNGSSSNLWSAPRLFVHQTSSETADRVYVVTNLTAGTRYIATDRGSSVKDVSIFGAIGDGVTDDTAAIQAAIDSLPLPSTNSLFVERGGSVFIPAGTYKITAPLRMRPGKIEGASRFSTVLINYGLTNDVIACMTPSNTPPTGIWLYRVAHMSIHQDPSTVPTSGAGIRVQADDGVTASMVDVEDVFMHGTFRGFHGSALQGSSLKNLTIYASKDDGILWDVYQTMVQASGCWTYYCGQNGTGHGWHLQGPAYCTVTASGADSNYGWGWYVESGTVQAPRGNIFTVGAEQNRDGGILIKNAIGGVYSPMVVTPDDLPTAADGIVVDNGRMVGLVGAFTQQGAIGGTGYPLRITNGVPDYPSVTVNASYLNSYNTGSEYHQTIGIGTYLPWEERGFIGLNTDGKPRRMLDVHDRTGAVGNTTGHELARLALHTADTNGNAFISITPDGETTFHRIIANNLRTNTVFNYGTNGDTVFLGPSAPLSGDNGSFLFQLGTTPVMSIKGGDTLGGVGIGTTRPNPAALLDIRSSTRGILLPSWESTEFKSGLYGSGQYTPPGLLAYDSDARSVRVQTRNADDGLTNNQYTTLFGYVDRDLRLGTAHRQIGKIWPQSVHATDTNIGSVYIYFTAENVVGLEIEQNSFRAGPFQYGTFGDTIIRNSYSNSAGAYGNLLLMAGDNASVTIGNGTARGTVTISNDLVVADTITLGGVARTSWPTGSGTNASTVFVDGTQVDSPNFVISAKLDPSVSGGTNVSFLPRPGTLQTNDIDATFHALLVAGGGAGDVTLAGTNNFTGPNSFAADTTASNLTVTGTLDVGDLNADSFTTATPIGFSSGGHGATNAAGARTALGVEIGADVQAWSAYLQQLATVGWASGNVPYFDGSNLTNLATTAAGRTLLTAANAAAQWAALLSSATTNGTYDASSWDGITDRAPTLDQIRDIIQGLAIGSNAIVSVTSPLHLTNGVLSINTAGLGGGGGVEWLANDGLGTWQGRDAGTNWVFASFTISSNDVPTTTGQYIFGRSSMVLSNYSGGSATVWIDADLAGTKVFRSSHTVNVATSPGKPYVFDYAIVKESGNTLSLVVFGGNGGTSADPYIGTATGSMVSDIFFATNVAYTATSNLVFEMRAQSESTNATPAALGIRRVQSSMLRYTTATTGTGDVVGPASSTTNNIAVFADATGKLIADGGVTVASLATEAEVAAGYEPLNANKYQATNAALTALAANPQLYQATNAALTALASNPSLYQATNAALTALAGNPSLYQSTNGNLTTLATLNGAALTNLNASSIASGTLSSNLLPSAVSFTTLNAGTINASAVVGDASGLTGINATNITAGTLPDARLAATIARTNAPTLHSPALLTPTLASPTLNDSVTFEQTVLAAHSTVTNFVADPTVSPYQTINADLASSFVTVGFLHATNVAAGRGTTVLVFAGTNAAVTVSLAAQFARNTNSVALTTGQILPISFLGYGSSPTNIIATMGTPYTR